MSFENFTQDLDAKTLSFYAKDSLGLIQEKDIKKIIKLSAKIQDTARLSLHTSAESMLQLMLIYHPLKKKIDIKKYLEMGCAGVQMGTRFIGTYECDASDSFKEVLLNAKEEDIKLMKSPVGYPARGVKTNLQKLIEEHKAPKVKCISNCVAPRQRGVEAKKVGYCIADRLSDAYMGDKELGLFFTGSNGYKIDKLVSVKELMDELTGR